MDYKALLQELLDSLKLSKKKFAETIGASQGNVSDWFNKPNAKPSIDVLKRISDTHNVNLNWLVTGRGTMYNVPAREKPPSKLMSIDIIPDIAAGTGYDCSYSEPLYTLQMPASFLRRPGPFYGFRVSGDSMAPDIQEGDVVILSGNWERVNVDGLICGFRTADGMVLKRLVLDPHKKEGWLFSNNQFYKPLRYGKHTPDLVMIGVLCALIRDYFPE